MKCFSCGCTMARSIQERKGILQPYPEGFLTCCSPACRIVLDINTGNYYKHERLVGNINES